MIQILWLEFRLFFLPFFLNNLRRVGDHIWISGYLIFYSVQKLCPGLAFSLGNLVCLSTSMQNSLVLATWFVDGYYSRQSTAQSKFDLCHQPSSD